LCREETSALYGLRSAATVAGNKPAGLLQGIAVSCHALVHGRIVQSLSNGTFNACSFWLAESLARAGRLDVARLMLEKMLTYSNHVGLYAEEVGPTGEALGNYPQAFTHLSLITACYNIDQMLNRAYGHHTVETF